LRNRVAHDYQGVNVELIISDATSNLPELQKMLEEF